MGVHGLWVDYRVNAKLNIIDCQMEDIKFEKEDARAQLASLQQLRTHWSGVITSHLGLALTINIGVITYFLKAYIDSTISGLPQYTLLFSLSALTSIILGLWRLYTHYIDNSIANLYPDFLKCEYTIGLSNKEGTMNYLKRELSNTEKILDSEKLTFKEKLDFISELIKIKRIGTRGHLPIDLFSLSIQIVLMSMAIWLGFDKMKTIDCILTMISFLGILFTVLGVIRYQKWTRKKDINKTLEKIKPNINILYK